MRLSDWTLAVKERDGYTCQECGVTADEIGTRRIHAHHIKPRALGGKNTLENGITLCRNHHRARHVGNHSPHAMIRDCSFKGVRAEMARRDIGFSELANRLGVHRNTVNYWFRGDGDTCLPKMIWVLMAIGMDKDDILDMKLGDLL